MRQVKIFCPKCEFVPQPADRWVCLPACGCLWNTFETCGVCPRCGRNWEETQCLRCHRLSPHIDWYHEGVVPPEPLVAETHSPQARLAGGIRRLRGVLMSMALMVVLVVGLTGCRSREVRPDPSIGIQGWVNAPGYYLLPLRDELSVADLIGLAGGLPGRGLQEMEQGRRLGAELFHEGGGGKVTIEPARWNVPLRDLRIDLKRYNRLQITSVIVPVRR